MKVKINNIAGCDFTVRIDRMQCTILRGESSSFDNLAEKIFFELIPHNKLKSETKSIVSAVKNTAANLILTVSSVYEICADADEDITININSDVYEHNNLKGDLPFAYLYGFIDAGENKNIKCIASNAVDEKDVMKLYKHYLPLISSAFLQVMCRRHSNLSTHQYCRYPFLE